MAVFEGGDAHEIINKTIVANVNEDKLNSCFQFLNDILIGYDVQAPKDKWVIKSINNKEVDRIYDNWSLINGSFN